MTKKQSRRAPYPRIRLREMFEEMDGLPRQLQRPTIPTGQVMQTENGTLCFFDDYWMGSKATKRIVQVQRQEFWYHISFESEHKHYPASDDFEDQFLEFVSRRLPIPNRFFTHFIGRTTEYNYDLQSGLRGSRLPDMCDMTFPFNLGLSVEEIGPQSGFKWKGVYRLPFDRGPVPYEWTDEDQECAEAEVARREGRSVSSVPGEWPSAPSR